jgi:hypothetical protein
MRISINDAELLIEALGRAATRHESEASALKPGSYHSGAHDRKAVAMRSLRARLAAFKAANQPMSLEA